MSVSVNGTAAPLIYVAATQINFQVPYEIRRAGRTNFDIGNVVLPLGDGFFALTITAPAPTSSSSPTVATGHLAIVDARNAENLKVTKVADISLSVNGRTGELAIAGGKLYVATATGLRIYKISQ